MGDEGPRLCLALLLCLAGMWPGGAGAVDYDGLALRAGQIVVADSVDGRSVFWTLVMRDFSSFTHSGILAIDDGRPVVYQATGKWRFWRDGPPSAAIVGRVVRTPFDRFLARHAHVEIYEPPPSVDRRATVDFARRSHRKEMAFDARFARGRDRYYCSEFVAYALEAGGGSVRHSPVRRSRSLRVLWRWLNVTARRGYPVDALLARARYRGAITSLPSRTTYRAYRAAKRELHRRFTPDQKLGNVLELDGKELVLRTPVRRFIQRAMAAFSRNTPAATQEVIRSRVRAIAKDLLGPWQG